MVDLEKALFEAALKAEAGEIAKEQQQMKALMDAFKAADAVAKAAQKAAILAQIEKEQKQRAAYIAAVNAKSSQEFSEMWKYMQNGGKLDEKKYMLWMELQYQGLTPGAMSKPLVDPNELEWWWKGSFGKPVEPGSGDE